ncbi:MAG: hypothetical protein CM15mP45_17870 [Deltaproteobacteria bacterium]|nr:MAG: hypothetical protein CM15mP45_17870 [Deltaproteobacteria bacterium]
MRNFPLGKEAGTPSENRSAVYGHEGYLLLEHVPHRPCHGIVPEVSVRSFPKPMCRSRSVFPRFQRPDRSQVVLSSDSPDHPQSIKVDRCFSSLSKSQTELLGSRPICFTMADWSRTIHSSITLFSLQMQSAMMRV